MAKDKDTARGGFLRSLRHTGRLYRCSGSGRASNVRNRHLPYSFEPCLYLLVARLASVLVAREKVFGRTKQGNHSRSPTAAQPKSCKWATYGPQRLLGLLSILSKQNQYNNHEMKVFLTCRRSACFSFFFLSPAPSPVLFVLCINTRTHCTRTHTPLAPLTQTPLLPPAPSPHSLHHSLLLP